MAEQQIIQTAQSADSVTFTVMSSGEKIPTTISVKSITCWQELNRVPKAKLIIIDGSPADQNFEVSSGDFFTPGKEIDIHAGYHSDEEIIFKGIVTKQSISMRIDGQSYLTVECQHEVAKMTQIAKSRYFYDQTESDIWTSILGEYGIDAELESTSVNLTEMLQFQSSDWDFLISRAEQNGYFLIADHDSVKIAPPDFTQDISQAVIFGSSLLSFDAEMDASDQVSSVLARTWDYSKTELSEVEAKASDVVTPGNMAFDELSEVYGNDGLVLYDSAKQLDELLQKWADARRMRHELAKIQGRARFQGIPEISAGKVIELQGLGERFSGKAFVSAVRHDISGGNWLVDVQFGLSTESFTQSYPVTSQAAAGLLPAISGLHLGVVTQLQDDPAGDERILVNLPIVAADDQGIWARLANWGAGESRGIAIRPEIGDEVVVGFVNDDPNHPIVLGALNSGNLPSPIPASDDNHEKGWVTRSEITFLVNDDEKSVKVSLPSGRELVMSDDSSSIELKDGSGNIVKLDDDGITIESAKDIILKAAQGDVKMESLNFESKASIALALEGATAELKGSGSTTISGGIVQIN